jgi:hypothetical protein
VAVITNAAFTAVLPLAIDPRPIECPTDIVPLTAWLAGAEKRALLRSWLPLTVATLLATVVLPPVMSAVEVNVEGKLLPESSAPYAGVGITSPPDVSET